MIEFAAPWYAFGILGLAVPLILHLIGTRRKTVVRVGKLPEQPTPLRSTAFARRLSELLRLALRCLAIALTILALMEPRWHSENLARKETLLHPAAKPRWNDFGQAFWALPGLPRVRWFSEPLAEEPTPLPVILAEAKDRFGPGTELRFAGPLRDQDFESPLPADLRISTWEQRSQRANDALWIDQLRIDSIGRIRLVTGQTDPAALRYLTTRFEDEQQFRRRAGPVELLATRTALNASTRQTTLTVPRDAAIRIAIQSDSDRQAEERLLKESLQRAGPFTSLPIRLLAMEGTASLASDEGAPDLLFVLGDSPPRPAARLVVRIPNSRAQNVSAGFYVNGHRYQRNAAIESSGSKQILWRDVLGLALLEETVEGHLVWLVPLSRSSSDFYESDDWIDWLVALSSDENRRRDFRTAGIRFPPVPGLPATGGRIEFGIGLWWIAIAAWILERSMGREEWEGGRREGWKEG